MSSKFYKYFFDDEFSTLARNLMDSDVRDLTEQMFESLKDLGNLSGA